MLVRDWKLTTAQLIARLKNDPDVQAVEANYLRQISAQPNDTLFSSQWSLRNAGQPVNGTTGTGGSDIKFVPAWALARPSATEVVVGVIDTGVAANHPDLAASIWVNPGELGGSAGIDDDGNGRVDDYNGFDFAAGNANSADSGDHGTHVAGTIAATGNNQAGIIGVNHRARIMALKVSSNGTDISTSAVIAALEYATAMKARGVNIVALNASFGGGGYSSAEVSAIQACGGAGIILCAAAGNNAGNNDTTPLYPASYRLSNMIVVAASTQGITLAGFSNYGAATVDLAAPGVNILSPKPDPSSAALTIQGTSYLASPMTFSGSTPGIIGQIYACGLGYPGNFPPGVSGNIALIQRGSLFFSEKVTNAMAAGARAVVIYNNVSGNFSGTLQSPGNWVPAISISQADGLAILAGLPKTGAVVATPNYQYLSGTSMATPHVSGAVAFAAMNFPGENMAQRIQRILTHVDVLPGLQNKVITNGRLNLLRTVDADNNSLPDWWESDYFGQSTGVNPNADSDHDGMTNLQEFLAGTVPTSPLSTLKISSIVKSALNNHFTITWPSVPGKTYRVAYSGSLVNVWLRDLPASLLTAGTGQTSLSYTDQTAVNETRRFYRVELVTP